MMVAERMRQEALARQNEEYANRMRNMYTPRKPYQPPPPGDTPPNITPGDIPELSNDPVLKIDNLQNTSAGYLQFNNRFFVSQIRYSFESSKLPNESMKNSIEQLNYTFQITQNNQNMLYSDYWQGSMMSGNLMGNTGNDTIMDTTTLTRNTQQMQQAQENSTSKFNSGWVLVEAYLMYDNLQLLSDAIGITAEIMATVSPLKLKPINILPPNYAVMGPVSKSILNSYKRGKTFRYSLSAAGSDRNSNVPKILIMTISNINTTGTKKIETPYWK